MTTNTMTLTIASDIHRAQRQEIEGPSKAQALRMAAARRDFLTTAERMRTANPAAAANLLGDARSLERDLRNYGFDVETGRRLAR